MSRTISTNYSNGLTLTNPGDSPLAIAAGIVLGNGAGSALQSTIANYWVIMNAGVIRATGTTGDGLVLASPGALNNAANAQVSGYGFGVSIAGSGGVVNKGQIAATETGGNPFSYNSTTQSFTALSAGLYLGGGAVANYAGASITGPLEGAVVGGGGSVVNFGSIGASVSGASAAYSVGLALTKGGNVTNMAGGVIAGGGYGLVAVGLATVTNQKGATISSPNAGVFGVNGPQTVINQGVIIGAAKAGVDLLSGGAAQNLSGGTIMGTVYGVRLATIAGSVSNAGLITSKQTFGGAGVDLVAGGSVTNNQGGVITAEWIGVQIGQTSASTGGTFVNNGTVFASDGTNGAAVWIHGPGEVVNNAGAGIATGAFNGVADGPFGIVAYYQTTVINAGSIGGTEFALDAVNAGFGDLVEVAPGASFSGAVLGAKDAADAPLATLELLPGASGPATGTINGFNSQYQNFGNIALEPGAAWNVNGTIAKGTTIAFGAGAMLAVGSPRALGGTIIGFGVGDVLALTGISDASGVTLGANNLLTVNETGGQTVTVQFDPGQSFTGASFAEAASGSQTVITLTATPAVTVDTGLAVATGGTGTITASNLLASETDGPAAQLTYTVTSGPSHGTLLKNGAAATTFTQADINNGLIAYQENGGAATSDSFGFTVNDANNSSVSGSFPITISPISAGLVNAYYEAILRIPAPASVAQMDTSELASGSLTTTALQTQLLSQAQATTVPALLCYDFMSAATPASSGLTFLTTFAADLQSGNYSFTGGFHLGTTPGEFSLPQFSVLNTFVNFCATDVQLSGSPFTAAYGSLAATASTANRTTFFNQVYQQIFGSAPAASTTSLFVNNLVNNPLNPSGPQITTFQFYVEYAGSELGAYGAIAGVLLSTAETSNLGAYPPAVNSFLTAAAVSGAAGNDTAPYGSSLLTAFPSSTPPSVIGNAMAASADNGTTITITSTHQLIDPGGGDHTIQFLTGASDDTLVLRGGGTDQVSGFDPGSDVLDLATLLSGANVDPHSDIAALSGYVTVKDQGPDALIGFDPTGQGGGATIAVLHGLGSTVTSLSALLAQGAVRLS